MANILVVDDELSICKALEKHLTAEGHTVATTQDGEAALELIQKMPIDVALSDLVMPKMDGITLIRKMKEIQPSLTCILLTGFGTIESAVQAMKAGAFHYLTKPFELDNIDSMIAKALEHKNLTTENREMKKQLEKQHAFNTIVGNSEEIKAVFDLIEKVAETDSTVLILGESGTGKELLARAVHYNSLRKEKPLITVNCAAIPEDLLESELFGHMRGSFTGAVANKEGRFSSADKGTLFLDEIGDMTLKLQVKLLRVLQERKFEPVGSTTTKEVDVRIIAATNRNLEAMVKEGLFREDLYYRLNVIPISVPPLRERESDISMLVRHFMVEFGTANKKNVTHITDEAMAILHQHPWPGNVRELQNMMERVVILMTGSTIEASDLPDRIRGIEPVKNEKNGFNIPDTGISFKHALLAFENELILKALEKTNWNKNQAASLLKINRTTLVEKIKKKNLERNRLQQKI